MVPRQKPESKRLKFHTQTAGQSLTAQQPLNNIVRVTIQAPAAVMGGTQSLHMNSYDEALALPSEDAMRVALRTKQIIAEESGAADIVDPMGGSFAIEKLTNEMEAEIMAYIEEIKEIGDGSVRCGVLDGITQGYFHREIQEASYEYQQRVDVGLEVIYSGLHKSTDEIVQAAVQEDVDVLGISILSGVHDTLVPKVIDGLKAYDAFEDILIIVGGIIPEEDRDKLYELGVAKIFGPGASMAETIEFVRENAPER